MGDDSCISQMYNKNRFCYILVETTITENQKVPIRVFSLSFLLFSILLRFTNLQNHDRVWSYSSTYSLESGLTTPTTVRVCPTLKVMFFIVITCEEKILVYIRLACSVSLGINISWTNERNMFCKITHTYRHKGWAG